MVKQCEICVHQHDTHADSSVVSVDLMAILWTGIRSNAAVDWETLGKVFKKQSTNSITLNPFIRRREPRFQGNAVTAQTLSTLPLVTLFQPVYPMLLSEYMAGVELLVKFPSIRQWPLFHASSKTAPGRRIRQGACHRSRSRESPRRKSKQDYALYGAHSTHFR